mmetsp:Transcript_34493/g.60623  ORF Transcript_34493/g.60623 Transcript_34493/m.60623 type:complete len:593 (+) Transcript_34493:2327-4105(+)
MAQRVVKVTNIEGFEDERFKLELLNCGTLLIEHEFDLTQTQQIEALVNGKLQVYVRNLDSDILGSLSIDAESLPEEGSYWLPLACSEEDFLEAIPDECRVPCLLLEISPVEKSSETEKTSRSSKSAEEQKVKKDNADKALKSKVLNLESSLKAEKWKRQELAENSKHQLDAANFKIEKLQACLKKVTEKLQETEAKVLSDKSRISEAQCEAEKKAALLASELETANRRLAEEHEEGLAKDQEIASLMKSLADLAHKEAEDVQGLEILELKHKKAEVEARNQRLEEDISSLRSMLTTAHQKEDEAFTVKELLRKLEELNDELDLSKRLIKNQQAEFEKEQQKASALKESLDSAKEALAELEEKNSSKQSKADGKVDELKQCARELSEQNQVLADELAKVQAVLKDQTAKLAKQPYVQYDSSAVQELKDFLKKKKLENKIKAKAEGQFIMQDVKIKPYRRQQQLLVNIEGNLSFLESLVKAPRSVSVSCNELPRRKVSTTPVREHRTAHKRNMTIAESDTSISKKSDIDISCVESSFEIRPLTDLSQISKASKENKIEKLSRFNEVKNDIGDMSMNTVRSERKGTLRRQKTPFK